MSESRRYGLYVRARFPPSSTLLTVVHLAGPISTRLRANGVRHRCRPADASSFAEMRTMAELYDAAMAAYPTIARTRSLPSLKVPLLPASKDVNSQAQAEIKLSIIVNAVHEMISQEQRQALWQAQLSPLQPPVSTQSTLFPENR